MKTLMFIVLFIVTALFSCKKDSPPVANFSAPSTAYLTEPVNFTSQCEDAETITWDFGDGGTGEGVTVIHAFQSSGVFNVKLTAENSAGTDFYSQPITVSTGKAEYNVINGASFGIHLISCEYGDPYTDFRDHGLMGSGDSTGYFPTNLKKLGLCGKVNSILFVCVYPFIVTDYTKNHLAIYDTTTIYFGMLAFSAKIKPEDCMSLKEIINP